MSQSWSSVMSSKSIIDQLVMPLDKQVQHSPQTSSIFNLAHPIHACYIIYLHFPFEWQSNVTHVSICGYVYTICILFYSSIVHTGIYHALMFWIVWVGELFHVQAAVGGNGFSRFRTFQWKLMAGHSNMLPGHIWLWPFDHLKKNIFI